MMVADSDLIWIIIMVSITVSLLFIVGICAEIQDKYNSSNV